MEKQYRLEDFKKIAEGDSFRGRDIDLMYFSISKEEDFPKAIRKRVNSMIRDTIFKYEKSHRCSLDVHQLELDIRLLVSMANAEHKPESTIDITLTSCETDNKEILIYDEFVVGSDNPIYMVFKKYFMERLGRILFR